MQLCPAKEKAFAASFDAAPSTSASDVTITGVELPSSSFTRLRALHRNHLTGELARLDRGERVRRHRARRLDPCRLDRLARLLRDRARHLLVAPADQPCDLHENLRALVCGQRLRQRTLCSV